MYVCMYVCMYVYMYVLCMYLFLAPLYHSSPLLDLGWVGCVCVCVVLVCVNHRVFAVADARPWDMGLSDIALNWDRERQNWTISF